MKSRRAFSFPENLSFTPVRSPTANRSTHKNCTRIHPYNSACLFCFFNFGLYYNFYCFFFFPCFFSSQELFVETIAKDAYCCAQQGKRKTLQRRDLGKVSLWYLGSGGRQERAGQGFPLHWLRRHHCKMSGATGLFLRCFLLGCHSARKPYLLKICFGWLERCWDREPKESRCCQS